MAVKNLKYLRKIINFLDLERLRKLKEIIIQRISFLKSQERARGDLEKYKKEATQKEKQELEKIYKELK